MVVLEKDVNCDIPESPSNSESNNLREERKRTGRYVAAGTAIFLSILGVYEALIQGTPEYVAIFVPAVIMFVYVLWILYTSRHQNAKRLLRLKEAASEELLEEVILATSREKLLPIKVDNNKQFNYSIDKMEPYETERKVSKEKLYNRSYSIA
ncbi:hypothetical protein RI129_010910 [Pyrocoelia pectoralis]|uniref:Uncharacterized protein n=1 Tax=Pyrocoelia pectoralis TaxID=417401 RepID=A0AAN7VB04_9COLE